MKTFEMGTGRIVYKTVKFKTEDDRMIVDIQPVFKGTPEKVVRSMVEMHGASGTLAIIDKLPVKDAFWQRARKYTEKLLNKKAS